MSEPNQKVHKSCNYHELDPSSFGGSKCFCCVCVPTPCCTGDIIEASPPDCQHDWTPMEWVEDRRLNTKGTTVVKVYCTRCLLTRPLAGRQP